MTKSWNRLAVAFAVSLLTLAACDKGSAPPVVNDLNIASAENSATPAGSQEALKPGKYDKVLTISSDDAKVFVTGIFLDGRAMQTDGLGTAKAHALLIADPDEGNGTPCDSEGLEVRLSNGVIFRPKTNFCNSRYLVSVPAGVPTLPSTPPTAPEGFTWESDGRGSDKMVYYGLAQTDATAFLATCRKGETRAQARIYLDEGGHPRADFFLPDRVLRYDMTRTSEGGEEQAPTNEVDLRVDDPLFAALRQGKVLMFRMGQGEIRTLDASGGTAKINEFLQWCAGE